jgi:hypothetical protein
MLRTCSPALLQVKRRIAKLRLPIYAPGNAVFYYDLFFALTAAVIAEKEREKKAEAEALEAKKREATEKAKEIKIRADRAKAKAAAKQQREKRRLIRFVQLYHIKTCCGRAFDKLFWSHQEQEQAPTKVEPQKEFWGQRGRERFAVKLGVFGW